jgi:hypothetical protein
LRFVNAPVALLALKERYASSKARKISRLNFLQELNEITERASPRLDTNDTEDLAAPGQSPRSVSRGSPRQLLVTSPSPQVRRLSLFGLQSPSGSLSKTQTGGSLTARPSTSRAYQSPTHTESGLDQGFKSPSLMLVQPKATINARFSRLKSESELPRSKITTTLSQKQGKPSRVNKCLTPRLDKRPSTASINRQSMDL